MHEIMKIQKNKLNSEMSHASEISLAVSDVSELEFFKSKFEERDVGVKPPSLSWIEYGKLATCATPHLPTHVSTNIYLHVFIMLFELFHRVVVRMDGCKWRSSRYFHGRCCSKKNCRFCHDCLQEQVRRFQTLEKHVVSHSEIQ